MLILYCAMKYDYGRPEQGYSFEHYNFYDSLVKAGNDIIYFDFKTLLQQHGKGWMNRRLKEVAVSEKPPLMLTVLFTEEIEEKTIRTISDAGHTLTLNWFTDDHWRFENFSRAWAPQFNWVVTTSEGALSKYRQSGIGNVIKSQWACNHFLYRKLDLPLAYDVTFVGQPHGIRRALVESLRQDGIDVRTWGTGWQTGRASQEEMIRIFNQSRINLNLSNASVMSTGLLQRAGRTVKEIVSRGCDFVPCGQRLKKLGKGLLAKAEPSTAGQTAGQKEDTHSLQSCFERTDQIKGRNFEVPGCGGFLLTGRAENLEEYYVAGREVAVFDSVADLKKKIRLYLDDEGMRSSLADAGYQRTLQEHTYAHRFSDILGRIGFSQTSLEEVVTWAVTPGQTIDIK
jgi:spore maturation protein CgeB